MFATLILLLVNAVVYLCTCVWPTKRTPYTLDIPDLRLDAQRGMIRLRDNDFIDLGEVYYSPRSKNVDWKKEGF